MSKSRKIFKIIRKSYQQFSKHFISTIKKRLIWLLRTFFISQRRQSAMNGGFVLPTVAMVVLVVVLLTTAILFRSFERSQNASNVRVNETVLKAATPALDRAKAKISNLFSDPTLPRSVPSNTTLYSTLYNKIKTYTLGDETPITLAYDLNNDNNFQSITSSTLEDKEILETAWKFPVDTDNNGKFDSFTLYGIYFRSPPLNGTNPARIRSPLDARTPPMLPANAGISCDLSGDTSASLVGNSGWYKVPTGELKKSFFVYAVTVPLTDKSFFDNSISTKYETYKGNKSFSGIELQQDRTQIPITNNAVVYEDDLDITPGPTFRLNGRIITNSNLLTRGSNVTAYQVSSPKSCYYERENGQIVVGGNVAGGGLTDNSDSGGAQIDLFNQSGTPSRQSLNNKSTSNVPNQVAYNSQAYAQRINLLVNAQKQKDASTDPKEVQDNITRRTKEEPSLDPDKVRKDELTSYFRKRTRRVPFVEVPYSTDAITKSGTTDYTVADVLQGSGDSLRPPDKWIYPDDSNTQLTLDKTKLPAIDPDLLKQSPVKEIELGDRILVGNNLPELRWDNTTQKFLGDGDPQNIPGQTWENSDKSPGTKTRTRTTRVRQLADLGITARDGFWERSAASIRTNALDVNGGLRVITGAGVYRRAGSFMQGTAAAPPTATDNPKTLVENEAAAQVVWSDVMPMLGFQNNDSTQPKLRGDLVMRATAVYHYNKSAYDPLNSTTPNYYQTPIACVSSYYNPTNATSATTNTYNPLDSTTAEASNNGLTYRTSTTIAQSITRPIATDSNGLFITTAANAENVANSSVDLLERLKYQANLVFPNSRFVNPLLRQALKKSADKPLTLSEQSAIDSTLCAIQIADGTLAHDGSLVPDSAIQETAFLDGRQIKAIDADPSQLPQNLAAPQDKLTGKYDLAIEQRQPLEIRATVIDLSKLKQQSISGTWSSEYLLPNSGIIYATRDDAQLDSSDPDPDISAADYLLDPERRPNAIMLTNGSDLSRQNNYRPEEKGLILATDLPVYVKGDFNVHNNQEFKGGDVLTPGNWDSIFYTRSDRDSNFACRPSDPRLPNCTTGETWRPAAVIADAVTLLSKNFQDGYRSDGDYDLRNNQGNANNAVSKRFKNGFADNSFVTSSTKVDDAYYSVSPRSGDPVAKNSSYLNNFVTPIQRRANFPEYVMEMCFKLPVSECGIDDWYVGYDQNGDNIIIDAEKNVRSSDLPGTDVTKLVAGTTARSPKTGFERYARRVAFKRNFTMDGAGNKSPDYGQLINASGSVLDLAHERPIALGIKSNAVDKTGNLPDLTTNALWFATTTDTAAPPRYTDTSLMNYNNDKPLFYNFPRKLDGSFAAGVDAYSQPLLEPIIQLQATNQGPTNTNNYSSFTTGTSTLVINTRWLSRATQTTFNLLIAAGDTPGRVGSTKQTYEQNGGLHNFVRFLENWDRVDININGSFIQFKRSAFATAPYQALVRPSPGGTPTANSIFNRTLNTNTRPGYNTGSTSQGEAPFYMAPNRNWGFDVGLISQNPDLFSQRFVVPSTDPPNEYYREVGRDDPWVKTLLCAVQDTTTMDGFDQKIIKIDNTNKNFKFAIPATEHPNTCPVGVTSTP